MKGTMLTNYDILFSERYMTPKFTYVKHKPQKTATTVAAPSQEIQQENKNPELLQKIKDQLASHPVLPFKIDASGDYRLEKDDFIVLMWDYIAQLDGIISAIKTSQSESIKKLIAVRESFIKKEKQIKESKYSGIMFKRKGGSEYMDQFDIIYINRVNGLIAQLENVTDAKPIIDKIIALQKAYKYQLPLVQQYIDIDYEESMKAAHRAMGIKS